MTKFWPICKVECAASPSHVYKLLIFLTMEKKTIDPMLMVDKAIDMSIKLAGTEFPVPPPFLRPSP